MNQDLVLKRLITLIIMAIIEAYPEHFSSTIGQPPIWSQVSVEGCKGDS